jgi:hypothetical protein
MADLSLTPVATQIKPVQGASLGDMINMARGAQQYQQAAQINPLELQQKEQATRTGEIALSVEEQRNKERMNFQNLMSNPDEIMSDGRFDPAKFTSMIPKIMPLTGIPAINDLTNLAKSQTEAFSAKRNMDQGTRQIIASKLGLLGRAGVKDPTLVANELNNLIVESNNDPEVKRLVTEAYLPIFTKIPPEGLPDALIKSGQSLWSSKEQQSTLAPTITTTEGGRTVITQPSIGAAAPTATVGVLGGLQAPSAPSGPIGAGTEVAPGMRVPYPVRSASQPYIPEPTEAKDQASGQAYRDSLVTAQTGLAQNRRNVEEVIQQANKIGESLYIPNFLAQYGFEKGGAPEKAERAVRQFFGSEQYDMLAKDLANLAITNSKAMGAVGGTVAGLDMASVANGTTKVTPDVLVKIARRVQADQTGLDMQANGAQQFAQRFGDNNMKAYQQAWNANADTKIFEAMNIIRDVTKPERQKEELNRLFPNANQYKEFLTKYRNLKQLSQNGVVGGQ